MTVAAGAVLPNTLRGVHGVLMLTWCDTTVTIAKWITTATIAKCDVTVVVYHICQGSQVNFPYFQFQMHIQKDKWDQTQDPSCVAHQMTKVRGRTA